MDTGHYECTVDMFLRFYSMVLLKILVIRYLSDTMESNFGNMFTVHF